MKRVMQALDVCERWAIATLMVAALFFACLSTAGRYLFPGPRLDWTLEVTIFMSTWAILIGAARLVGQDGHVRVDSLINLLPPRVQGACAVLALLIAIATAGFLTWSGYIVVEEAIRWKEVTTSSLRIPLWYYYLAMPVAMSLMTLHAVVRTYEHLRGRELHPVSEKAH